MSSSSSRTPKEAHRQDGFLYTAGPALASGAAQAVLFNPVDRALYVRVKFRRKRFLDWRNFERPFQGFFNAAVYRTLVGASYMFWQDSARIYIERFLPQQFQADTSPQLNSFVIGLFAGSVNGLALNTLQAVKFRMWNTDEKGVTFLKTARLMYSEGGIPIFFRGCVTTMVRDSVFGVVYETTRRSSAWKALFDTYVTKVMEYDWLGRRSKVVEVPTYTRQQQQPGAVTPSSSSTHTTCAMCAFISNLVAAITASMLSSPFNYVRSVVYGTPPGAIPLGYWTLLRSFYTQFFYIWRNGQSYTDFYRIPKLDDVEHSPTHKAGASRGHHALSSQTSPSSTSASSPGKAAESPNGIRQSPAAKAAPPRAGGRAYVTEWFRVHHHHPIAACKWANSRLNIGWGSIRVGLGMAMSQSLFHITQDFARRRNAQRTGN